MSGKTAIHFIGRTTELKRFDEVFKEATKDYNTFHFLSFYGIGGMGKTTLMNQIIKENFSNKSVLKKTQKYYVTYDFEKSTDMIECLVALRNQLGQWDKKRYSFLRFDLAYIKYIEMTGTKNVLASFEGNILDDNSVIKAILETAALIPGASIFSQAAKAINETKKAVCDAQDKKRCNLLMDELKNLNAEEVYEKLPEYFAEEISDNDDDKKEEMYPLTIFLDTFEKVTFYKENKKDNNWISRIIAPSKHVVWVISGRTKNDLPWKKLCPNSDDVSNNVFDLARFSDKESEEYLKASKIPKELYASFASVTKKNPLWLELAVSIYNASDDKEHFNLEDIKELSELANRYICYMDNDMQDLVKQLAIIGEWNEESYLLCSAVLSFNATTYGKVRETCIVTKDANGYYHMQEEIRDAVCKMVIGEDYYTIDYINNRIYDFYVEKLNHLDPSMEAYYSTLTLLIEFYVYHEKANFSYEKMMKYVLKFHQIGANIRFFNIMEILDRSDKVKTEDNMYLHAKYRTQALLDIGKYEAALRYISDMWENIQRKRKIDERVKLDIHELYAYALFRNDKYEKAGEEYKTIIADYKALCGDQSPEVIMTSRRYAECLMNKPKYRAEALEKYTELYKICSEFGQDRADERLRSMQDYSVALWNAGKREEATDIDKEIWDERKGMHDDEGYAELTYADTLMSEYIYATDLWNMDKYADAKMLFEEVYDKWKELYGETHPDTLRCKQSQAITEWSIGSEEDDEDRKLQAKKMLKEIWDIQQANLGENHRTTLRAKQSYITAMWNTGEKKKASEAYKENWKSRSKMFSEDDQDTLSSKQAYAITLLQLGHTKYAIKLDKEVYDARIKALSKDHADTLKSKLSYAIALWETNKYEEAKVLIKEVLETRKRILGPAHRDTKKSEMCYEAICDTDTKPKDIDLKSKDDIVMYIESAKK